MSGREQGSASNGLVEREPLNCRIAYADPPYPGCAHLYKDHPDYDGEVNHYLLAEQLADEYDGFILHTSSVALGYVLRCIRSAMPISHSDVRIMPWIKDFAAFKANVPVAYAWEPVLVKACRKPVVSSRVVMRDWIKCPMTMKRGLTGVKPDAVCRWAFEVVGAHPDDELVDLFPGTGAVTHAWESWRSQLQLATEDLSTPAACTLVDNSTPQAPVDSSPEKSGFAGQWRRRESNPRPRPSGDTEGGS